MAYLILSDFKRAVQADNLQQVINKDASILNDAILDSQAFAKEQLVQKFVLDQELEDIDAYDPSIEYTAGQRVYLDGPAYNPALTYIQGELTLYNGIVYVSNQPIPAPEAFNPLHWIYLGPQFSIFYVAYPKPLFQLSKYYKVGDEVFWNGSVYACQIATVSIDHTTLLQYGQYNNVPLLNVFPDDPNNGTKYWGIGVPYSVPAGTLYPEPTGQFAPAYSQTFATSFISVADGTNSIDFSATLLNKYVVIVVKEIKPLTPSQFSWNPTTGILTLIGNTVDNNQHLYILYSNIVVNPVPSGWIAGDNRNRSLVRHCVALALYFIHDRIAPRNVPELRARKYKEAVTWLKDAADGNLTSGLQAIQPRSGGRVRWGSNIKNINSF